MPNEGHTILHLFRSASRTEALARLAAIDNPQAVIEFDLDGTILTANAKFLQTMGYALAEIQGKHQGMFVEAAYHESADYRAFWARLNHGEYQAAQFKGIAKDGKEVWIEASHNPILDLNGRPYKVAKFATDISAQVNLLSNFKTLIDHNFGEIDSAIERSSAQAAKPPTRCGKPMAGCKPWRRARRNWPRRCARSPR